jgi:hypothetical protein
MEPTTNYQRAERVLRDIKQMEASGTDNDPRCYRLHEYRRVLLKTLTDEEKARLRALEATL